jgi:hypothetical protein
MGPMMTVFVTFIFVLATSSSLANQEGMTNQDVLEMTNAKVSTELIV